MCKITKNSSNNPLIFICFIAYRHVSQLLIQNYPFPIQNSKFKIQNSKLFH